MKYIEFSLDTPETEIESRCNVLSELGIGGFQVENENDFKSFLENNKKYWDYIDESLVNEYKGLSRIKFWIEEDNIELIRLVESKYPEVKKKNVQSSDWENNWRQYYKPIEIGNRLVVVPEWEQIPQSDRVPLILEPGLIFGTGSHPTTKMCLEALEKFAGPGKKVLDLGCGSGILGIGALVLGCDSCVGVDIDPMAPDVVLNNTGLNPLSAGKLRAFSGDVTKDESLIRKIGSCYDIVLANIVADVIIALSPNVGQFMADNAVFICSGIIDGRENEVEKTLAASGFDIIEHMHEDEWNAYVCRKHSA